MLNENQIAALKTLAAAENGQMCWEDAPDKRHLDALRRRGLVEQVFRPGKRRDIFWGYGVTEAGREEASVW